MKSLRPLTVTIVALAAVLAAGAGPACAGLDIDLAGAVSIGNDDDVWVSVAARYFDRDRGDLQRHAAASGHPDDLAVALFVARHAGVRVGRVHALRRTGLSWWDVSLRLGVPVDAWFVPTDRRPGPPYGRAYGHYKKHGKHAPARIAVTDVEARDLVAIRMIHEYWDVPVTVAMEWRSGGDDLRAIMAREYRHRHGPPAHAADGKGTPPGHARKHGKPGKKG